MSCLHIRREVLDTLAYMIVYAPDFPPEDQMTLERAYGEVVQGLVAIEGGNERLLSLDQLKNAREILSRAKQHHETDDILRANDLLQDVAEMLGGI